MVEAVQLVKDGDVVNFADGVFGSCGVGLGERLARGEIVGGGIGD